MAVQKSQLSAYYPVQIRNRSVFRTGKSANSILKHEQHQTNVTFPLSSFLLFFFCCFSTSSNNSSSNSSSRLVVAAAAAAAAAAVVVVVVAAAEEEEEEEEEVFTAIIHITICRQLQLRKIQFDFPQLHHNE